CSTPFGIKDDGTVLMHVREYHVQNRSVRMRLPADGEHGVELRQSVKERERNHLLRRACT
ncbi:MAG: hypothetical protein J0L71_11080, partial [Candidatus Accumulibacter sp.]|uniref:hypothetical protein n=1 Tax=Accumulibacter sp. TaxID=2053492 RepID=UPI001AD1F398